MLVNVPVRLWRRPVTRAVLLSAAIIAAPLPSFAGETSSPGSVPSPSIKASVAKVVNTERLAVSTTTARAQDTGVLGSPSFFKTRAGIITVVALVAGVSFALYSTSHDRVKSPNRTYGGGQ